jgi:hypothetical protein
MSEETASAKALSAYYKFETGAPLAYGGLLVAIVLAIAAQGASSAALWVAAAAALLLALHNWPLSRQLSTALSVSDYGFFLDGLGLLAWKSVKAARVEERKLGKIALPELVLDVDEAALKAVLTAAPASGLRRLQYRPWRAAKGHLLRVDLGPLGVDPQALLSAITPRLAAKSSVG